MLVRRLVAVLSFLGLLGNPSAQTKKKYRLRDAHLFRYSILSTVSGSHDREKRVTVTHLQNSLHTSRRQVKRHALNLILHGLLAYDAEQRTFIVTKAGEEYARLSKMLFELLNNESDDER